jgi:hypothetical protein
MSFNAEDFNQIQLNAVPGGGAKVYSSSVDAKWVRLNTYSGSVNALWQKRGLYNGAVDALWQGGSTKFSSVDALWVTPYHDNGSMVQLVGNNLGITIDPNRLSTWTTYNRPPVPFDGMHGINTITGKHEHYNAKSARWEIYDGTAAP